MIATPGVEFKLKVATASSNYSTFKLIEILMQNPSSMSKISATAHESLLAGSYQYLRYSWAGGTDYYGVQGSVGLFLATPIDFNLFVQHSINYGVISANDLIDSVAWNAQIDYQEGSLTVLLPIDDGGRRMLHRDAVVLTANGQSFFRDTLNLNYGSSDYFNVSHVSQPVGAVDFLLDYLLTGAPLLRVLHCLSREDSA